MWWLMYGSIDPRPGPLQWSGEIKDYNPDHNPSASALTTKTTDGSVIMILQVKGLGVVVMRASYNEQGELVFNGVSEFNRDEIGFYPER